MKRCCESLCSSNIAIKFSKHLEAECGIEQTSSYSRERSENGYHHSFFSLTLILFFFLSFFNIKMSEMGFGGWGKTNKFTM